MSQANKFRKYLSLYSSTTNSFGAGTGETITPASVTGLPTDTEITLTFDRVDSSGKATPAKMERITGTISGGNFVISERGVDGSTEQAHTSPVVEMIWNADDWNDALAGILTQHNQSGGHTDITASNISCSNVSACSINLSSGVRPTAILDEDNMASNSATALATQQSTKAYIDSGWQTASDGATITFDLGTGAYRKHKVTLGGNRTLALSNVGTGQAFIIALTQDGSGSRTVTWFSTIRWADGSAPTLTTTANKRDVLGFIQTGENTYDGFVVGQNL